MLLKILQSIKSLEDVNQVGDTALCMALQSTLPLFFITSALRPLPSALWPPLLSPLQPLPR